VTAAPLARLRATLAAIECRGDLASITPAQKAELWRLLAQCPSLSDRAVCLCRSIALDATPQSFDRVRLAIETIDAGQGITGTGHAAHGTVQQVETGHKVCKAK
jgi:hypothetical protein